VRLSLEGAVGDAEELVVGEVHVVELTVEAQGRVHCLQLT